MTEDTIARIEKTLIPSTPKKVESQVQHIGKKFGHLTVLEFVGTHPKRKTIFAKCKCDCGDMALVSISDVKRHHTTSCGCRMQSRIIIHGEASSLKRRATNEYVVWVRLRKRAPRSEMCEKWINKKTGYLSFLEDMGRRPDRCFFERIDQSKPYNKGNCHWKPMKPKNPTRLTKLEKLKAEYTEFNERTEWVVS